MRDHMKLATHIDMPCPHCGQAVTVSLTSITLDRLSTVSITKGAMPTKIKAGVVEKVSRKGPAAQGHAIVRGEKKSPAGQKATGRARSPGARSRKK